MTKELFVEIVNEIEELYNKQNNFSNVLYSLDGESNGCDIYRRPIEILENILKEMVNDPDNNIDFYMWELDFGKNYEDGDLVSDEGKYIPLRNANDLYNLLFSSQANLKS